LADVFVDTFFRGIDSGDVKLASFDRDLAWPTAPADIGDA